MSMCLLIFQLVHESDFVYMFTKQSSCLQVCLHVYQSVYVSRSLSHVYQSVYVSTSSLHVQQYVYVSASMSLYSTVWLRLHFYQSGYVSARLSLYLTVCLVDYDYIFISLSMCPLVFLHVSYIAWLQTHQMSTSSKVGLHVQCLLCMFTN